MNYKDYMTMKCMLSIKMSEDEDTQMSIYDIEKEVPCFSYGKNVFIRNENNSTVISAKAYILIGSIKVGDKIDGQVVRSVNEIPEFDGTIPIVECLTWYE